MEVFTLHPQQQYAIFVFLYIYFFLYFSYVYTPDNISPLCYVTTSITQPHM